MLCHVLWFCHATARARVHRAYEAVREGLLVPVLNLRTATHLFAPPMEAMSVSCESSRGQSFCVHGGAGTGVIRGAGAVAWLATPVPRGGAVSALSRCGTEPPRDVWDLPAADCVEDSCRCGFGGCGVSTLEGCVQVFLDHELTQASDVYALGLLLWEMLHGVLWCYVWAAEKQKRGCAAPP